MKNNNRCHGEKNNVVYEMAKDKNLLGRWEMERLETLIRSNGEEISSDLAKKLSNTAFDIYDGDTYETEKKNYPCSMGNFFAKK